MPVPVDDDVLDTMITSDRRVWQRRSPAHGSLGLSLQVFAILYDAGRPLSLEELAAELEKRIDPVSGGYVEAWHLRRMSHLRSSIRRRRGLSVDSLNKTSESTDRSRAVRAWVSQIFLKRIHAGQTLVRDAQGLYSPGPGAPRIHTMDGRLLRYTPEMRHQLAQEDHDKSRTHIALLEWKQVMAQPEMATFEARVGVLMFLLRRLMLNQTKTNRRTSSQLDERALSGLFTHLLRVADTPVVKANVIRQIVDEIFATLPTSESTG